MKQGALILACFVVFSLIMPFVAAYGGFGSFYFFSPQDLLQSEWVRFSIAFVFFYALIFFAGKNAFKGQTQAAVVVAFVGALIVSYALLARGYLDFYIDNGAMDTIVLIAFIILLGVLVRFLYAHATKGVGIMTVFLIWAGLAFISSSGHSSLSALPYRIRDILDLAGGPVGFIVALVLAGIMAMKSSGHRPRLHDHPGYNVSH